jgi:glyoxylase-like metal-dependent hydrolase (beta-lactamase superfamily II)
MGYIIKTDDNVISVIDGGDFISSDIVEKYLIQLGGKVDYCFITHIHEDHSGTLLKIIERKKIIITNIIPTSLNEDWVQEYEPNAFDLPKQV